ncbi:MATE family efflux transporter [Luteolibacter yonseiensis]|uniref:Multidrug-efflux transporter n=1 Tax=Luteolibacter yonseiensis TaxID=1144680 RepID=A0A934R236_9BACT|nr:MATE family efflux transporter [Luteolibacter yonseiensis]MBK1816978.1 MATE family efflux transporter [Luteolibacter yonseiensis]
MNLLHESRLTLRLAVPLMIGQLSQMLMGVVDTLMVGHLGVNDLAALTFANSLFHIPFVFGIGLLTGVSVFTSNSRGADDAAGVRGSCRHGLYLAVALGILLFGLAWIVSLNLHSFGQPEDVAGRAQGFFRILMASVIPGLASIALKNHADALNRPWPPFWIFLGGVALNVVLNWVMINGNLGCPVLGFEGAAWATLISRVAILVAMIFWLTNAKGLREWVPYRWFRMPRFADLGRLLSIGLPASFQMLCEVSAFSLAGLIMGRFGPTAMAAHQIAITMAATAFMIPLGLSMALTVRIGEADGAGETQRLRPIAVSGWWLGAGYSVIAALLLFMFGKWVASLFIDAPEVISLAGSLLMIVGFFQLFDSLQVASAAMLRGMRDARMPALMGFASYWLVGLPVGAGLAFGLKLGAIGVWWGLAAGLFVAMITLGPRLWKCTRPPSSVG